MFFEGKFFQRAVVPREASRVGGYVRTSPVRPEGFRLATQPDDECRKSRSDWLREKVNLDDDVSAKRRASKHVAIFPQSILGGKPINY